MLTSKRSTPRIYWATPYDFHVYLAVKKHYPPIGELLALRSRFPAMYSLLEKGANPNIAVHEAELRYLLSDLTEPLSVWPPLTSRRSPEARRLQTRHALRRAESRLSYFLARIDAGPGSPRSPKGPQS